MVPIGEKVQTLTCTPKSSLAPANPPQAASQLVTSSLTTTPLLTLREPFCSCACCFSVGFSVILPSRSDLLDLLTLSYCCSTGYTLGLWLPSVAAFCFFPAAIHFSSDMHRLLPLRSSSHHKDPLQLLLHSSTGDRRVLLAAECTIHLGA
jgi:hypothetical protein